MARDLGPAGEEACIRDWAPGNRQAGHVPGLPHGRERVEETVGARIMRLPDRPDEPGHRRAANEEVERHARRERVQVPGPNRLGREDAPHPVCIEIAKQSIVDHSGRMHDAAQRPAGAPDRGERRRDLRGLAHVGRDRDDVDAGRAHRLHGALRFRARGTRTSDKRERTGALRGEPLRDRETEAAEPAGHQIGGIGPNHPRRLAVEFDPGRLLVGDHDLADVIGIRHVTERAADLVRREELDRQRLEVARNEIPDDRFELGADRLRALARDAREIDHEERHVLAQAAQPDQVVAIDVALADLQKPSAGREQCETFFQVWARQRVQHHVDPAALCGGEHVIRKAERTRVEHVGNASGAQVVAFLGAARGRDDARAAAARDRDRGEADAARRGVDQDGLARIQPRQRAQGVLGGRIGGWQRRSRRKRKLVGNFNDQRRRRRHMRGECPAHHRDHPASNQARIATLAGLEHDAGAFQAEMLPGGRILGIGRQQTCRRHDIAEIQSDCADVDQHLAGPGARRLHLAQTKPVERAGARHRDAERRRPQLGLPRRAGKGQALLPDRGEAARQALVPAQRDHRLGFLAQHFGDQIIGRRAVRIRVDHPHLQLRHLVSRRPHHPEHRCKERRTRRIPGALCDTVGDDRDRGARVGTAAGLEQGNEAFDHSRIGRRLWRALLIERADDDDPVHWSGRAQQSLDRGGAALPRPADGFRVGRSGERDARAESAQRIGELMRDAPFGTQNEVITPVRPPL